MEENIEDSTTEFEENYASDNMTLDPNGLCECEDEILKDTPTIVINEKRKKCSDSLDTIPEKDTETEVLPDIQNKISYSSILKGTPSKYDPDYFINNNRNKRSVSFPADLSQLVSFCEPDNYTTWTIRKFYLIQGILS